MVLKRVGDLPSDGFCDRFALEERNNVGKGVARVDNDGTIRADVPRIAKESIPVVIDTQLRRCRSVARLEAVLLKNNLIVGFLNSRQVEERFGHDQLSIFGIDLWGETSVNACEADH